MSIQRNSHLLFQLVLRHDYFRDGLAKGIAVAPTRSGAAQLSRFGGQFVADEGGGFVVYPGKQSAAKGWGNGASPLSASPLQASPIDGNALPANAGSQVPQFPDNVTLAITVTDPQFSIFTALPTLAPSLAWYCNNLGGQLMDQATLQPMQVQANQFTLDFTAPDGSAATGGKRHLRIARLNGEVVVDKSFYASPSNLQCPVDLRLYSDGAYHLEFTVEGISQPFQSTFYKSEGWMGLAKFGFFEWFALQASSVTLPSPPDLSPPTVLAGSPVQAVASPPAAAVGAPSPLRQHVIVQLHARETIWQYYLVSKTGTKVQQPTISPVKVHNRTITFTETGQMLPLPNGSFATRLTASGLIPLKESPHMEIMLEAQGLAKGMRLPYAAPNLLYESYPGGHPSSRIYVYF